MIKWKLIIHSNTSNNKFNGLEQRQFSLTKLGYTYKKYKALAFNTKTKAWSCYQSLKLNSKSHWRVYTLEQTEIHQKQKLLNIQIAKILATFWDCQISTKRSRLLLNFPTYFTCSKKKIPSGCIYTYNHKNSLVNS